MNAQIQMSRTSLDDFVDAMDNLQKTSWLQAHGNWRVVRNKVKEFRKKRRLLITIEVSPEDFERLGIKYENIHDEVVDTVMQRVEAELQEECFGPAFRNALAEEGLV